MRVKLAGAGRQLRNREETRRFVGFVGLNPHRYADVPELVQGLGLGPSAKALGVQISSSAPYCGIEQWQFIGLISRMSQVRFLLPQPYAPMDKWLSPRPFTAMSPVRIWLGVPYDVLVQKSRTLACHARGQGFKSPIRRHASKWNA